MSILRVAAWNIFFSFEIYRIRNGKLEINPEESKWTKQTKAIRRGAFGVRAPVLRIRD